MGRRKQSDTLVEALVASEDKKDGDEEIKEFLLEGRRKSGNAWHDCDVSIRFHGPHHMLGVVFHGDEYDPNENIKDEIELLSRLRPCSKLKEIENGQCSQVQVGDIVLARKMSANQLQQYFNACVVKIHKKRHSAKARCKCGFEISWIDSAEMEFGTEILQVDQIRLMTKDADLRQHPVISKWLNLARTNQLPCESMPSSSLGSQIDKAKEAEENVSSLKPADGHTASRSSRGRKAVTGSKSNKLSDDDDNKAEEVGVPIKKPPRARGRKGITQTPPLDRSAVRTSQTSKLLPFTSSNLSESSLKMTIVASLDKDTEAIVLPPLKEGLSRRRGPKVATNESKVSETPKLESVMKVRKTQEEDQEENGQACDQEKEPSRRRGLKVVRNESNRSQTLKPETVMTARKTQEEDGQACDQKKGPSRRGGPRLARNESNVSLTPKPEPVMKAHKTKEDREEDGQAHDQKMEPARRRGPRVVRNESNVSQTPNLDSVMKAQKTQEEEDQKEDGQACEQKKEPPRKRGPKAARNESNMSQMPKPDTVMNVRKTQEEDQDEDVQACDKKKEPSKRRGPKVARNESNASQTPKPEPVVKSRKIQEEVQEEDGQACDQKKEPSRRRGLKVVRNESNSSQTPKLNTVLKAQKTQEEVREEDGPCDQKKEPSRRRGLKVARNESNTSQTPKLNTVLKAQKTQEEVREEDGQACDQKKQPSKSERTKVVKNELNTKQTPTLDQILNPKLALNSNLSESSLNTMIVASVDKDIEAVLLPPIKKEPSRRRGPKAKPVMKAQEIQESGQEEDGQACDQKKQPSRRRGPKVARNEANASLTPKPEPVMKAEKIQEGSQEEDGQACVLKKQPSRRRGAKVARNESNASQTPKLEPVMKLRKTQEEDQEEDGQACDQENAFRTDEPAPLLLQSTRGMEILGTINGADSANNNRAIIYSVRKFPNHVHSTKNPGLLHDSICANEATKVVPSAGNGQTRNIVSQKRPREEEEELRLSSSKAKKAKQHYRTSFIAFDELPVGFGLGISGWPSSLGINEAGNNVDPSAEMETHKACSNGEKGIGSAIETVVGEEETEVKIINSVIKAVSDVEDQKCKEGKTEARMKPGRGKRKDPPSQITTSTCSKPITESKRGRKAARLHVE